MFLLKAHSKQKVSSPVLIDYCPKDLGICPASRVTLAAGRGFDFHVLHLHSDGDGMQEHLRTMLWVKINPVSSMWHLL